MPPHDSPPIQPPGSEAGTVSLAFDPMLRRFERAWQKGERPDLDAYLGLIPRGKRLAVLRDLVPLDLEYRLKAGEAARVEDYLRRYPDLAADADTVLDLAAWEFRLRRRSEPELTLEEYVQRLPWPPERLRERLAGEATVAPAFTLPPFPAPPPGKPTSPPGFELLEVLGQGAMGLVYRARQIGLGRQVAIKMIRGRTEDSESARVRFMREARAVAQLKHPAIVPIYTVGEHDGQPYFVMEFIPGGSLSGKLDGKPWPSLQAAELVATLASAVQHAHEQGVLHRDLKPANVLLDRQGRPFITDFGLARAVPGQATGPALLGDVNLTCDGSALGTPAYMPPEQARGAIEVMGPCSDVFGLGAILYHLLTGRPPYQGDSVDTTLLAATAGNQVPVRQINPRVHSSLARICTRAMAAEPAKRYPSAAVLEQALRAYLQRPRKVLLAAAVGAPVLVLLALAVALAIWLPSRRTDQDRSSGANQVAQEQPVGEPAELPGDDVPGIPIAPPMPVPNAQGPGKPYVGIGLARKGEDLVLDHIDEGSPAEKAGLKVGDVLVGINGIKVANRRPDLAAFLRGRKPGDVVPVEVRRGSAPVTLKLTLGRREQPPGEGEPKGFPFPVPDRED
jgi:serine/threonine protein kinase